MKQKDMIKNFLLLEIEKTNLSARIKNRCSAGKIKFIFELILSLEEISKFRNLREKSLEEIKEFLKNNSPESQEKTQKFLMKICQEVGKIKLQDISNLMDSKEFRELNKKYFQLRQISLPDAKIKDFKSKKLGEVYSPKEGFKERSALKDIKKKYQDLLHFYDFEFLIEDIFKEKIIEALKKPD